MKLRRWLILAHRYLGIALGLVMVVWCLSGVVMMYVRYPSLAEGERLTHLAVLDWRGCCAALDEMPDDQRAQGHATALRSGNSSATRVPPPCRAPTAQLCRAP